MEDKLLNEKQTEQENSEQKVHATLLRGHWRTVAVLLSIYDIIAINLSYFLALWLRYDCKFSLIRHEFLHAWMRFVPIYTVFCLVVFWVLRLYRSLWKYASYSELMHLILATIITGVFHTVGITLIFNRMPISYYMIGITLQFVAMAIIRFSYRFYILMSSQRKEDEKGNSTTRSAVSSTTIPTSGDATLTVCRSWAEETLFWNMLRSTGSRRSIWRCPAQRRSREGIS